MANEITTMQDNVEYITAEIFTKFVMETNIKIHSSINWQRIFSDINIVN